MPKGLCFKANPNEFQCFPLYIALKFGVLLKPPADTLEIL